MHDTTNDKSVRRVGVLNPADEAKLDPKNGKENIKGDTGTRCQQERGLLTSGGADIEADTAPDPKGPAGNGVEDSAVSSKDDRSCQTAEKETTIRYVTKTESMVSTTSAKSIVRTTTGSSTKCTKAWYFGTKPSTQETERCFQELDQARIRIAQLESEQEQLEASFRKIQAYAFKRFDAPGWKPECNDDISRKLDLLDTSAKKWAKENSISNMNAVKTAESSPVARRLIDTLKDFVRPDGDRFLISIPDDKAWVMTQAYILYRIYIDVFEEPFFGLANRTDDELELDTNVGQEHEPANNLPKSSRKSSRDFANSLQSLYDEFCACNVQEAVSWRVQTLRQLRPTLGREDEHDTAKKMQHKKTAEGLEKAAGQLTLNCLTSGIHVLIRDPERDDVKHSLRTLILKAADLSYSLWTQKIHLSSKYIHDKEIGSVFAHDNDLVEAHQLQNKYLDDDPRYLDNSRILVVTHPALVRHGDEEAADFGVRTTLKRAICWMAQPVTKGPQMQPA